MITKLNSWNIPSSPQCKCFSHYYRKKKLAGKYLIKNKSSMISWKQTNNHQWWWRKLSNFLVLFRVVLFSYILFFWEKGKARENEEKYPEGRAELKSEEKLFPSTYFYDQTFEFKLRSRQRYGESKLERNFELLHSAVNCNRPKTENFFFFSFDLVQFLIPSKSLQVSLFNRF